MQMSVFEETRVQRFWLLFGQLQFKGGSEFNENGAYHDFKSEFSEYFHKLRQLTGKWSETEHVYAGAIGEWRV